MLCVIFSPLLSDDYVGTEDWTDYGLIMLGTSENPSSRLPFLR